LSTNKGNTSINHQNKRKISSQTLFIAQHTLKRINRTSNMRFILLIVFSILGMSIASPIINQPSLAKRACGVDQDGNTFCTAIPAPKDSDTVVVGKRQCYNDGKEEICSTPAPNDSDTVVVGKRQCYNSGTVEVCSSTPPQIHGYPPSSGSSTSSTAVVFGKA
jgi:hypothetical protein